MVRGGEEREPHGLVALEVDLGGLEPGEPAEQVVELPLLDVGGEPRDEDGADLVGGARRAAAAAAAAAAASGAPGTPGTGVAGTAAAGGALPPAATAGGTGGSFRPSGRRRRRGGEEVARGHKP